MSVRSDPLCSFSSNIFVFSINTQVIWNSKEYVGKIFR